MVLLVVVVLLRTEQLSYRSNDPRFIALDYEKPKVGLALPGKCKPRIQKPWSIGVLLQES